MGVQKQFLGSKYLPKLNIEQVKPKSNPIAFVQMPDYESDVKTELLEFLVMLFKLVIGEGKDVLSEWGSSDSDKD